MNLAFQHWEHGVWEAFFLLILFNRTRSRGEFSVSPFFVVMITTYRIATPLGIF